LWLVVKLGTGVHPNILLLLRKSAGEKKMKKDKMYIVENSATEVMESSY